MTVLVKITGKLTNSTATLLLCSVSADWIRALPTRSNRAKGVSATHWATKLRNSAKARCPNRSNSAVDTIRQTIRATAIPAKAQAALARLAESLVNAALIWAISSTLKSPREYWPAQRRSSTRGFDESDRKAHSPHWKAIGKKLLESGIYP